LMDNKVLHKLWSLTRFFFSCWVDSVHFLHFFRVILTHMQRNIDRNWGSCLSAFNSSLPTSRNKFRQQDRALILGHEKFEKRCICTQRPLFHLAPRRKILLLGVKLAPTREVDP
jgi:hypothetical protein